MTTLVPAGNQLLPSPSAGTVGGGSATLPLAPPPSNVNLPNALTAARLLVVPLFAFLLWTGLDTGDGRLLAWALFTGACLTDVVDGHLARSRNQVTSFGVMADPIADKALMGSALLGLALLGLLPWWATVVILGRELAITVMRTALLRHGLLPANRGGKLKCLAQNTAVALYLLPLSGGWTSVREPVLWLAVALTVLSALPYAASALRLRSSAAPLEA